MSQAQRADRFLTVGEALLRFTPSEFPTLQDGGTVRTFVGGAEANVAVGLATLGRRARFFSRLPDGPLGDLVVRTLRGEGVEVAPLLRVPGRLGHCLVLPGAGVVPTRVHYDREGATFVGLSEAELVQVLPDLLAEVRWLHLTGIDLTLAAAPLAALARLWHEAGERGVQRSFDLNLRSALPGAALLRERAAPLLATADVVFAAERDVRSLWSLAAEDDAVATLAADAPQAVVVTTRGAAGAAGRTPAGDRSERPALPAAGPGRIGRGDAFAAGFLAAWDEGEGTEQRLARALSWGVAAAALKAAHPGDLARLDRATVAELASLEALAGAGDPGDVTR